MKFLFLTPRRGLYVTELVQVILYANLKACLPITHTLHSRSKGKKRDTNKANFATYQKTSLQIISIEYTILRGQQRVTNRNTTAGSQIKWV